MKKKEKKSIFTLKTSSEVEEDLRVELEIARLAAEKYAALPPMSSIMEKYKFHG
jgi:hypothetical protein